MSLAEFAFGQAKAYARQKLSGRAGTLVDLAEQLYGKIKNQPMAVTGRANSGPRHWWQAARSRPDPILDTYWYVDLPALNGSTQLSWDYVEEATLPFVEFEQVSNYRAGKNYHYPSHHNISTLQLKFYGDVEGKAISYFRMWQALILNPSTGLYFPASQFKKDVTVTLLDVSQLTVSIFKYTGCWPTNVDQFTLTSGQTGRITPTLTLSVDNLEITVGKFESSQIPSLVDNVGKNFPMSIKTLPSVFPGVFSSLPGILFR